MQKEYFPIRFRCLYPRLLLRGSLYGGMFCMYNQGGHLLTDLKRAASGEEEHGNEEIVSGVPGHLACSRV